MLTRNVQLFYDAKVNATTAVLATFSTACFGYGIVGILRPLTVYPAEMVIFCAIFLINLIEFYTLLPGVLVPPASRRSLPGSTF